MLRQRGFTLIELLIVVAIIAILAMIAVPNFLEAQTRAKVSRAKNDLRTLAVAVEAYRVDANDWPFGPNAGPSGRNWYSYIWPEWRKDPVTGRTVEYGQWYHLTTPISYLTSIPRDTFWREFNEQWGIWRDFYRVWNLSETYLNGSRGWGRPSTAYANMHGVKVLMASVGPDRVEDVADGSAGGPGLPGSRDLTIYDPTNGTVSWGDIYYGLPGHGFDLQNKIVP